MADLVLFLLMAKNTKYSISIFFIRYFIILIFSVFSCGAEMSSIDLLFRHRKSPRKSSFIND